MLRPGFTAELSEIDFRSPQIKCKRKRRCHRRTVSKSGARKMALLCVAMATVIGYAPLAQLARGCTHWLVECATYLGLFGVIDFVALLIVCSVYLYLGLIEYGQLTREDWQRF